MTNKDDFYIVQSEPNKSCLLAMRNIVLSYDDRITETRKYGMPCFCFNGKAFCYLWIDKKSLEPYFLMVEGKLIDHPNLEKGNRSRMKIFRVDPTKDLPISSIHSIMKQAVEILKREK